MHKTLKNISTALAIAATLVCSCGMFVGCDGASVDHTEIEMPAPTPQVYALALQYGGEDIGGTLNVDISLGEISVTARVRKDEGVTDPITFDSTEKSVATVDGSGTVTLLCAGETVLSASIGKTRSEIVLVVSQSFVPDHSVTVGGGTASRTSAAEGDIVSLKPAAIAHKKFVRWVYSDNVEWTNGNSFRMPNGAVEVFAEYEDILYTLRLVGATVTEDGGDTVQVGKSVGYDGNIEEDEYAIIEYEYPYATALEISAVEKPANKMFVGWDKNEVNNRLDEDGADIDFVTTDDEVTTLWANYSTYNTTQVLFNACKKFPGEAVSLNGLSGFTVNIPANTKAIEAFNNDGFVGCYVDSVSNCTQEAEMSFRNKGAQDVTVEVYSHLGSSPTTGDVTVPAGQTVTKRFTVYPGMIGHTAAGGNDVGFNWSFALKNDVGSSAVALDIVGGAADKFPKGDPFFALGADKKYVTVDNFTMAGKSFGANWIGSTYTHDVNKEYNATTNGRYLYRYMDNTRGFFAATAHSEEILSLSGYCYAKITNLPAYDESDPYLTVNVRLMNLVNLDNVFYKNWTKGYSTTYNVAVSTAQSPFSTSGTRAETTLTVSEYGQVVTATLTLKRSADVNDYYICLYKTQYDTPDGKLPAANQYRCGFGTVFTYGTSEVTE